MILLCVHPYNIPADSLSCSSDQEEEEKGDDDDDEDIIEDDEVEEEVEVTVEKQMLAEEGRSPERGPPRRPYSLSLSSCS